MKFWSFFLANSLNWGVHSVDCDFIAGDFCLDFKSLNVDMNWNKLFWSNVACHLIWFYSMLLEICNKAGQWCLWPVCSSHCLVLGMGLEHGGKHRPWMPRWLVTPSYILVSMKPVTCLWMCSLNLLFCQAKAVSEPLQLLVTSPKLPVRPMVLGMLELQMRHIGMM